MARLGPAATVFLAVLLTTPLGAAQDRAATGENFKPFNLKTPEGTRKTLPDVLGKATLVVFFFPTCGYCNAAFPEIQKLHDNYKDRGLSMVWINVIPQQERLIAAWRSRHGYTVPILLGGRSVQKDYKLTMTPTHYLIDAEGKVLWKHAGYKPGDEKDLERRIQEALSAPSSQLPAPSSKLPAPSSQLPAPSFQLPASSFLLLAPSSLL